ncbi:MAG: hypothetical protein QOH03_1821, partial [Kribbellaceae bacterium]|nr:hypothetical protein [Kribbellaceae bacterium]
AEDALVALHGALMVDRASLAEQIALMSPGDITLAFFGQGHDLLTTCTYVHPGFLRWRPWGADARLADPDARPQGLLARGWQPPSTSVSESRA